MIERGLGIPRRERLHLQHREVSAARRIARRCRTRCSAVGRFLDGQIEAVRPKVIVALGKPATSLLLGRDVSITRVRGIWQEYRGIPLMPTFHPAFVLRQYTAGEPPRWCGRT